jgi:hypothetical protein
MERREKGRGRAGLFWICDFHVKVPTNEKRRKFAGKRKKGGN